MTNIDKLDQAVTDIAVLKKEVSLMRKTVEEIPVLIDKTEKNIMSYIDNNMRLSGTMLADYVTQKEFVVVKNTLYWVRLIVFDAVGVILLYFANIVLGLVRIVH